MVLSFLQRELVVFIDCLATKVTYYLLVLLAAIFNFLLNFFNFHLNLTVLLDCFVVVSSNFLQFLIHGCFIIFKAY